MVVEIVDMIVVESSLLGLMLMELVPEMPSRGSRGMTAHGEADWWL